MPIWRRHISCQPIKIVNQTPTVSLILRLRINAIVLGELAGCKTHPNAILNYRPASYPQIKFAIRGRMNPQLLTRQYKHAILAIFYKNRRSNRSAKHSTVAERASVHRARGTSQHHFAIIEVPQADVLIAYIATGFLQFFVKLILETARNALIYKLLCAIDCVAYGNFYAFFLFPFSGSWRQISS